MHKGDEQRGHQSADDGFRDRILAQERDVLDQPLAGDQYQRRNGKRGRNGELPIHGLLERSLGFESAWRGRVGVDGKYYCITHSTGLTQEMDCGIAARFDGKKAGVVRCAIVSMAPPGIIHPVGIVAASTRER